MRKIILFIMAYKVEDEGILANQIRMFQMKGKLGKGRGWFFEKFLINIGQWEAYVSDQTPSLLVGIFFKKSQKIALYPSSKISDSGT